MLFTYCGVRPLPYAPGVAEWKVPRSHVLHDHAKDLAGAASRSSAASSRPTASSRRTPSTTSFKQARPQAPRCATASLPLPGARAATSTASARLPARRRGRRRPPPSGCSTSTAAGAERVLAEARGATPSSLERFDPDDRAIAAELVFAVAARVRQDPRPTCSPAASCSPSSPSHGLAGSSALPQILGDAPGLGRTSARAAEIADYRALADSRLAVPGPTHRPIRPEEARRVSAALRSGPRRGLDQRPRRARRPRRATSSPRRRRRSTPLFPQPEWVELDPAGLWEARCAACDRHAMAKAGATADDIAAVGVTTHRETCLMWDRTTGRPVHHAIMWMSKQTDDIVRPVAAAGLDGEFRDRTGSATTRSSPPPSSPGSCENVPGVRERAPSAASSPSAPSTPGCCGTSPAARSHATDPSEASRTALFDLGRPDAGTTSCAGARHPAARCCPRCALRRLVRRPRPRRPAGSPAGRRARHRDPRRPAGGPVRAGVLRPGTAKNTFGTAGVLTANVGGRRP